MSKTYYAYVEFWAPHSGVIPVEADTEEDAKKFVTERLTSVRDLVFKEVTDQGPVFIDEDPPEEDEEVPTIN